MSTDTAPHVEHLDVFDETGAHRGALPRDEVHRDGWWHQVFHCQVVALRDGVPHAVLQLRAADKKAFPNLLDVSSAGHLAAGERPVDGLRELDEELGLRPDPSELVKLGVRRLVDDSGEGTLNRELTHVYVLLDDRPLDGYVTAAGEVDGVFEAPIADLLALLHDDVDQLTVDGVLHAGHAEAQAVSRTITAADLVPSDGYWTVLLVMAERVARGEVAVAI